VVCTDALLEDLQKIEMWTLETLPTLQGSLNKEFPGAIAPSLRKAIQSISIFACVSLLNLSLSTAFLDEEKA
jgi:hypothetical protein